MKAVKKIFGKKKDNNDQIPEDATTTPAAQTSSSSPSYPTASKLSGSKFPLSASTATTVAIGSLASLRVSTTTTSDSNRNIMTSNNTSSSAAAAADADTIMATVNNAAANADSSPHVCVDPYASIPVLEQMKLPRGGLSVDTKAVGRVQFGIPPETIKDSMQCGIPVPQVYIVPVERFCREMGPALGVNLAEFEFPAYFNFFVYKKRCTLVVDSEEAEENIRKVFSETLLGPAQFRRENNPITYEEEDFADDFPRSAIPNFAKELEHFRIMPDGKELVIETLLDFRHFEMKSDGHEGLGVPPTVDGAGPDSAAVTGVDDEPAEALEINADTDAAGEAVPKDLVALENMEKQAPWTYSQARFMGDVSTVWPTTATPEQISERSVPRVEIFKMPGGTEYIVHDIDENNHIIGKARFSGNVKVSESMSIDGFGGHSILDDVGPNRRKSRQNSDSLDSENATSFVESISIDSFSDPEQPIAPPSFHPPSFGVTVLGNSHGFDKSGSVSGYVLWINGRGVMIDPPPYSSATLEREGIRPRTIVGIILTHCHADHDAGAFQKVLTGSPVVVITTPTIYKSFIRKYAALSALSPALLRHSHRYKPAVIGEPLRFQGATFKFTYTLHTIPCVGFRVEWRGRSMVFTGDHFNSPPALDKLQEKGVLSRARADDLRNLPLQETDLLLHEAGAPPIHTPLEVLLDLPQKVKDRLFVVHTSALPEGCELRVAPTGTKGTIRLDQSSLPKGKSMVLKRGGRDNSSNLNNSSLSFGSQHDDESYTWSGRSEYETISEEASEPAAENESTNDVRLLMTSYAHLSNASGSRARRNSTYSVAPPLVSLRPASSTDAWFILNLLSAVPFLTSLSYSSTMELLETAKVDAYAQNTIVVPASKRSHMLCVVWEGTCAEAKGGSSNLRRSAKLKPISESRETFKAVWHAGDWTGPIALQPDLRLSGEGHNSDSHDVIAFSEEGVKVITVEFSSLHAILKSGSMLYRKYLDRKATQTRHSLAEPSSEHESNATDQLFQDAIRNLNILELIDGNSAFRKLSAVQKRHLESLAEGPVPFQPGERLWRAGAPVDRAFIIVSGTASFVPKRRNAGSATVQTGEEAGGKEMMRDPSVSESMHVDAQKAMKELGTGGEESSVSSVEYQKEEPKVVQFGHIFNKSGCNNIPMTDSHDYAKLSRGLQKRADFMQKEGSMSGSVVSNISTDDSLNDVDSYDESDGGHVDYTFTDDADAGLRSNRNSIIRRRSSRARFANKVLGRLYSRRAFTGGLVFSRGHFLGDVSKMVAGLLSNDSSSEVNEDFGSPYGFGDKPEGNGADLLEHITELIIHEQEGDHHIMHSSTLTAGKDGCVALMFPKSSLIPFLNEYPGLMLSVLGTQVVV